MRRIWVRATIIPLSALLIAIAMLFTTSTAHAGVGQSLVRVASVAQDAGQWRRIFRDIPPTTRQEVEIPEVFKRARDLRYTLLAPPPNRKMADDFLALYRSRSNQIVTFVGHNDSGVAYFPDGSQMSLAEFNDRNNVFVAISCWSSDYVDNDAAAGLSRKISYWLAFDTEQRFRAKAETFVAAGGYVDAALAQRMLNDAYTEAWRASGAPRNIAIAVVGGGIGLPVAGIVIVVSNDRQ